MCKHTCLRDHLDLIQKEKSTDDIIRVITGRAGVYIGTGLGVLDTYILEYTGFKCLHQFR